MPRGGGATLMHRGGSSDLPLPDEGDVGDLRPNLTSQDSVDGGNLDNCILLKVEGDELLNKNTQRKTEHKPMISSMLPSCLARHAEREEAKGVIAWMDRLERKVDFIIDYQLKFGALLAHKLQLDASQLPQFDKGQAFEAQESKEGHEDDGGSQEDTIEELNLNNATRCTTRIVRPPIQADDFENKLELLHLVQQEQFGGSPSEDPNSHIANFLYLCDTLNVNKALDDSIRLQLFPFSLRDEAKSWLLAQSQESITTWDDLLKKFLAKYFPPSKRAKMRSEITSFCQQDGESLYDAWERFKDLLWRCPHHAIPEWVQVEIFYIGLIDATRAMVDVSAGGSLYTKTPKEAMQLFETMAANNYTSSRDQGTSRRGVLEPDTLNVILAQNQALSQQVAAITKQLGQVQVGVVSSPALVCDFCGEGHANGTCEAMSTPEQINYMGNAYWAQNDSHSNTYNPGWRNHTSFSWNNTQGVSNSSSVGKSFQLPGLSHPHFPQQDRATYFLKEN